MKTSSVARLIRSVVPILLFCAGFARASSGAFNLSNNTKTQLASYISHDRVVTVLDAFVYRHLYGQEIVLKLLVKNLDYNKEIYLQSVNETRRAYFSNSESEFSTGGAHAFWVGNDGNFDIIYVKTPSFATISSAGALNPHRFAVYVKMAGNEFKADDIQLKLRE